MKPMARQPAPEGTPWTAYAKILGALACCTVVAAALFVLSAWLMLRKVCLSWMGGCSWGPLDTLLATVGLFLLPLPLVVFPVGVRVIRRLVYREIPRRRQSLVLRGFALFPVVVAILAYPTFKAYERARHWVEAERHRQEAKQRLQAAYVTAFRAAPIHAEVLKARLLEEHDTPAPDHGAGTLELTVRVQNAPLILPHYHLMILDLAEREISGRADSRLRVEPPYRMAWERRGASGLVTVRNEEGRWSYVEDGTSQVLSCGPDTFTTRLRYFKRVPALGPPRSVILSLFVAEDRDGVDSGSGRLYLAVPFPPFS
jgi:hypothetical protein